MEWGCLPRPKRMRRGTQGLNQRTAACVHVLKVIPFYARVADCVQMLKRGEPWTRRLFRWSLILQPKPDFRLRSRVCGWPAADGGNPRSGWFLRMGFLPPVRLLAARKPVSHGRAPAYGPGAMSPARDCRTRPG